MPPLGRSGSRQQMENHKRGRSLEREVVLGEKDDDLALFNDMNSRDKDNFLLPSGGENLDESLSLKMRCFSDFKLGVTIPPRGNTNDLLNTEGDKNDYDWLLTPPDTPLFPSLDDEVTPPPNLSQRGRARTQSIPISNPSAGEKGHKGSRTSASPHRLSPSPRPSSSGSQANRGRPSSAPNSGFLHPSTSSQRPSTPPSKPSSAVPRSSTPNGRRMSTGSSGHPSSVKRGPSPVNVNRQNSASPQLSAWQANLTEFSSEAPPNLRTSIGDRPASYVRGSSPASRNGRGLSPASRNGRGLSPASRNGRGLSPSSTTSCTPTKYGRRSPSPAVSRSGSSHSHEHDVFGSAVSSYDDDVESLHSVFSTKNIVSPAASDYLSKRRSEGITNNKGPVFSKKPSKASLSSSAPKRVFESAVRQMDHRKGPQSMFRPLLSSAPSSSFYAGKSQISSRLLNSVTSSVTTSSNASSELGASIAPDTDGSDHDQEDLVSEWDRVQFPDVQEEEVPDVTMEGLTNDVRLNEFDLEDLGTALSANANDGLFDGFTEGDVDITAPLPDETIREDAPTCLRCGEKLPIAEYLEVERELCESCSKIYVIKDLYQGSEEVPEFTALASPKENDVVVLSSLSNKLSFDTAYQCESSSLSKNAITHDVSDSTHLDSSSCGLGMVEGNKEQAPTCLPGKELEQDLFVENSTQQKLLTEEKHQEDLHSSSSEEATSLGKVEPEAKEENPNPSTEARTSNCAGISLLLPNRSVLNQYPVVHAKAVAAAIHCDEPLYVSSNSNCSGSSSTTAINSRFLKRSSSRKSDLEATSDAFTRPLSSGSASSGFEAPYVAPSRRTDAHLLRQLSTYKSMAENVSDGNSKSGSSGSVSSRSEVIAWGSHTLRDSFNKDKPGDALVVPADGDGKVEALDIQKADKMLSASFESSGTNDTGAATLAKEHAGSASQSFRNLEGSESLITDSNSSDNARDSSLGSSSRFLEKDLANLSRDSSFRVEAAVPSGGDMAVDVVNDLTYEHPIISSGEPESGSRSSRKTDPDSRAPIVESNLGRSDEDVSASEHSIGVINVPSNDDSQPPLNSKDEVPKMVEGTKGPLARNLTLGEATDTILFCSSIIHSLAYKAATIAIEKEEPPRLEGGQPTVTLVGRNQSTETWTPATRVSRKGTPKSQKTKTKRKKQAKANDTNVFMDIDVDMKPPGPDTVIHRIPKQQADSMNNPPKLESKCNCVVM